MMIYLFFLNILWSIFYGQNGQIPQVRSSSYNYGDMKILQGTDHIKSQSQFISLWRTFDWEDNVIISETSASEEVFYVFLFFFFFEKN